MNDCRMIVVGANVELQRQVALQLESTLSSYEAIAQIGFDATLGTNNVLAQNSTKNCSRMPSVMTSTSLVKWPHNK